MTKPINHSYSIRPGSMAYHTLKLLIANPGLQTFEIRRSVGSSSLASKLEYRGLTEQRGGLWYASDVGIEYFESIEEEEG